MGTGIIRFGLNRPSRFATFIYLRLLSDDAFVLGRAADVKVGGLTPDEVAQADCLRLMNLAKLGFLFLSVAAASIPSAIAALNALLP